jgi:signal transduction histidine kinase
VVASSLASIYLVGPPGTEAHAVALEAIRRAFPHATLHLAPDFATALTLPAAAEAQLLLLLHPRASELSKASAMIDGRGLSRWSVVARGASPAGSASPFFGVDAGDWSPSVLTQALQSANRWHALERENVRLRGDLRTISRRLAHDLRTPLNCISTAAEALRDSPPDAAAEAAQLAEPISAAIQEAAVLIDRVSTVYKATADPPPLQPATMEEIVWGTLQRLESRILKAGATITKPRTWPAIEGVPAWIDLIWVNLIANSLRHGGPKPQVELGWEATNGTHRFWLRDSGKGVPPEKRDRLFYPLDRLNELNAPRGLGLPIVHRLVELQGGRCGYDPSPAPGGTFFFTLRRA